LGEGGEETSKKKKATKNRTSEWRGEQAESPEAAQKEINEPERSCWKTGSQETMPQNH